MKPEIQIRGFRESDIDAIVQITNERFGKNYIPKSGFKNYLEQPNVIGLVTEMNHQIVAYSFECYGNWEEISKYLLNQQETISSLIHKNKCIGYRMHTAVLKKYENHGLGQKLVKDGIRLLEKKCNIIMSIAWESKQEVGIGYLLQKEGFKKVLKLEHYWKSESIEKNYSCEKCGSPPCLCHAWVFLKTLSR